MLMFKSSNLIIKPPMKTASVSIKLFYLISFLALNTSISAQIFKASAGLTISNFSEKELTGNKENAQTTSDNIYLAANVEFPIHDSASLVTGLSFISKGYHENYRFQILELPTNVLGTSYKVSLSYLEIPVLAKIYFNKNKMKFYGSLGPYISYAIRGNATSHIYLDRTEIITKENVNWGAPEEFKI